MLAGGKDVPIAFGLVNGNYRHATNDADLHVATRTKKSDPDFNMKDMYKALAKVNEVMQAPSDKGDTKTASWRCTPRVLASTRWVVTCCWCCMWPSVFRSLMFDVVCLFAVVALSGMEAVVCVVHYSQHFFFSSMFLCWLCPSISAWFR